MSVRELLGERKPIWQPVRRAAQLEPSRSSGAQQHAEGVSMEGGAAAARSRLNFSFAALPIYAPHEATPVQCASEGQGVPVDDATPVHEAARLGTSGAGRPLPHLERIQRSFGRHDLGAVVAHTDEAAVAGTRALSALAFTSGGHVAFARTPDLRTAAHEAAHIVQQRAGVELRGNFGRRGDRYERHADEVAARVVAGESSEALLDRSIRASGTARGGTGLAVQALPDFERQESPAGVVADEAPAVAMSGAGRLLESFPFEFQRQFPGGTLYDRSDQANSARRAEIGISRTRFASPEFRRLGRRAARDLAQPSPADVTVEFESSGNVETVKVRGPGGERSLSFRFSKGVSFNDMGAFLRQLLAIIAMLSRRRRSIPRGPRDSRVTAEPVA